MPLLRFEFEDLAAGRPRRAVPVRFACLAANWTPALLATLVSEDRVLAVHEADPSTKGLSDVHPENYAEFRATRGLPLGEALARLPVNHFVWSDDLVQAFSDHVDLHLDRESAWAEGLGIRWNPALGGCAAVVAESADLSFLDASSAYRVWEVNGMHNFVFAEKHIPLRNTTGLEYISYLLLHPDRPISSAELYLLVRPPVAVDQDRADAIQAALASAEEHDDGEESVIQVVHAHSDRGEEVHDDEYRKSIADKLMKLRRQHDDALESGNPEKATYINEQMLEITARYKRDLNLKGKPRLIGGDAEKARKKVSNAIDRAIDDLRKRHEELAAHVQAHIKTGGDLVYHPPEGVRWSN